MILDAALGNAPRAVRHPADEEHLELRRLAPRDDADLLDGLHGLHREPEGSTRRGRCFAETARMTTRWTPRGFIGVLARLSACVINARTSGRSRVAALSTRRPRTTLPLPRSR